MPLFPRSLRRSLLQWVIQQRLKEQSQKDLEIACRTVCGMCKLGYPHNGLRHAWIEEDGREQSCECDAQRIRRAFRAEIAG